MKWRNNLHDLIKHVLPEYKDGIPGVIVDAIDAAYVGGIEDIEQRIGMLRQWLNEDRITDPKRMITNEDIKHWLYGN